MGWLERLRKRESPAPQSGRFESPSGHGDAPVPAPGPASTREPSWYVDVDGDMRRFVGADGRPTLHLIPYSDSGGESVLRLCEDATGLLVGPTDRRLSPAGVYVSQIRGEHYNQAACRNGDFSPGAPVSLVREPGNPHDPKAVAVYDATGKHKAGYVNKSKARALARLIDGGEVVQAIAVRGAAAGVRCEQVGILAASPEVIAHLLAPRDPRLPEPAHLRRPASAG